MPNFANDKNKNFIQNQLSNITDNYFQRNKDSFENDMQTWIGKNFMNVISEMENFDFVNDKNPNYGLQSELKEMFVNINDKCIDYANSDREFDYNDWEENIGSKLNEFMDKLDNFNEATDYEYINSPKMRALKTYINKIEEINITVKNCSFDERINEMDTKINYLENRTKEVAVNTEILLLNCQENSLDYNNLTEQLKNINDIQNRMQITIDNEEFYNEIVQENINKVDNNRSFAKASLEFSESLLKNRVLSDARNKLAENNPDSKDKINELDNAIKQSKDIIKEKQKNLIETSIKTEKSSNIDKLIDTKINDVQKYSPGESKNMLSEFSNAVKEATNNFSAPNPFKEVNELHKNVCEFSKANIDSISKHNDIVRDVCQINSNVKSTQSSIRNLSNYFKDNKNKITPEEQIKNAFSKDLDRFLAQSDKCKRWGHRDSVEFLAMQQAIKDVKEDMSPDNIRKMKEAADNYLEKKGAGNTFNTKMRQHRKDLAKSISDFANKCAEFNVTREKANDTLQKGDNAVKEGKKDVLNAVKDKYKVEKENPINEKIRAFNNMYGELHEKMADAEKTLEVKKEPKVARKTRMRDGAVIRKAPPKKKEPTRESGF